VHCVAKVCLSVERISVKHVVFGRLWLCVDMHMCRLLILLDISTVAALYTTRHRNTCCCCCCCCCCRGIHPDFTGQTYLDILAACKAAASGIHVHAFSPLEVMHVSVLAAAYATCMCCVSPRRVLRAFKRNGPVA
jgi:hypothetical protein